MAHPSTPDIGRIERGIAPSLMFACRWCSNDLRVKKSVIWCPTCDSPEPPEPNKSRSA